VSRRRLSLVPRRSDFEVVGAAAGLVLCLAMQGHAAAHGPQPPRADRILVTRGSITVEQRVSLDDAEAQRLREQLGDQPLAGWLEARLRFLRLYADGRELALVTVERRLDPGPPGAALLLVRRALVPEGARILVEDRDKDPRISVQAEVVLDGVTVRSPLPRPALLFANHPLALWLVDTRQ